MAKNKEIKDIISTFTKEQKVVYDKFINSKSEGIFIKHNPYSDEQKYEIACAVKMYLDLDSGCYGPEIPVERMVAYRQYCEKLADRFNQLNEEQKAKLKDFIRHSGFIPEQLDVLIKAVKNNVPLNLFSPQQSVDLARRTFLAYQTYVNTYYDFTEEQLQRFKTHSKMHGDQFDVFQLNAIADAVCLGVENLEQYTPNTHPQIMNQLTMKDFLNKYNLFEDRAFLDHAVFENLPVQGWKIHFSCDSQRDYLRTLSIMIPELVKNNVQFKIVKPEYFQTEYSESNLYGKEFTIYPNENFKLSNFSQDFIDCLNEEVKRKPHTDKNIGGRANTRYGGFRYRDILDGKGNYVKDNREPGVYKPNFVDDVDIYDVLNFYDKIHQKLEKTFDYKLYMQEYLTGREYTSFDTYFIDSFSFKNREEAAQVSNALKKCTWYTEVDGLCIVSCLSKDREIVEDFCLQNDIACKELMGDSLFKNKELGLNEIPKEKESEKTLNEMPIVTRQISDDWTI